MHSTTQARRVGSRSAAEAAGRKEKNEPYPSIRPHRLPSNPLAQGPPGICINQAIVPQTRAERTGASRLVWSGSKHGSRDKGQGTGDVDVGTGDRRTDEVGPLFSRLLSFLHMHITARQAYTCARYVSSACMGCGLVYAVCLCVCLLVGGEGGAGQGLSRVYGSVTTSIHTLHIQSTSCGVLLIVCFLLAGPGLCCVCMILHNSTVSPASFQSNPVM